MRIVRTVAELREAIDRSGTVALVPTMGAFHEGHLDLMREARLYDQVVVSLFVNPTQFAPTEDLARYPRPFERDCELAEAVGVDLLFAPSPDEVYPRPGISVRVPEDDARWEMAIRPGHFSGVATVVLKLLNMAEPDVALFGWKDLQQCWVIRRMVEDLNVPVRLQFVETRREPDGLAMSSRNVYLSPEERVRATAIYRELRALQEAASQGASDPDAWLAAARDRLTDAGLEVQYLEWISLDDLAPTRNRETESAFVAAVKCGSTRLIDNVRLSAA